MRTGDDDVNEAWTDPRRIAEALQALAARPGPVTRERFEAARPLWLDLIGICRGRAQHRDAYDLGKMAWQRIRDDYEAEKARRQAAAKNAAEDASRQEAPPPVERDEPAGKNAQQKRRMITALEQAARAPSPQRFAEHVRLCEEIWAEIGPAGPEDPALAQAYASALAAYRQAVETDAERGSGP